MKKNLFYLFALICSMSLFTACSDNEDPEPNPESPIDGSIAGDYKGLMDVYYENPEIEIAKDMVQKITLTQSSSSSVSLELKNFAITLNGTSLPIGDLAIADCVLTVKDEVYSFSGSADLELIVGKCAVSVTGTVKDKAIELTIKVNVDNGAMEVRVEYKGEKMSGNESSEALIKEFKFESDIIAEQPVINEETITFKVVETATDEDLKALKPIITISENATITPESGVAQDFSDNKVVIYKVTSEDGSTVKEYKVFARKSSDAFITSFTFESSVVAEQPVINNEAGTITFKVKASATEDDLRVLVPTIEYSHKATITPASGVAQDFLGDKHVTYTVTSEDGTVTKEYDVYISGRADLIFSFDAWTLAGAGKAQHEEPLPKDLLASSVEGASLLFLFGVEGFPVYKSTDDKVAGNAAIKLVTMDTSAKTSSIVPALTAGSVFTGSFDTAPAMSDRMSCTRFGVPYGKKPLLFKGWYKYTAGEKYIDGEGAKKPADVVVKEDKMDECSIMAILYETENDGNGKNIPLTGHDINNSPRRVAVAALPDGTNKTEWTSFSLEFKYLDGKTYDSEKEYQLAIVCSSSKEGDRFKGAGGSTLMLDELEVIGE